MYNERWSRSMNARTSPFGTLLAPSYDHHGLRLDLYGINGPDGYEVRHVLIPGSLVPMTECVSAELLDAMSAKLDDTLPSAEQLRKESADEARIENAAFCRMMAKLPELSRPP
jgi:hypothetical protein